MKTLNLFLLLSIFLLSISSCTEKEQNDPVVGTFALKIKFKIKHYSPGSSYCDRFPGICVIINFLTGDPVESDEAVADIELGSTSGTLILHPDRVIWDSNGNVPVSENQSLPSAIISGLSLPSGSFVVAGTYTVDGPQSSDPKVVVNYAY